MPGQWWGIIKSFRKIKGRREKLPKEVRAPEIRDSRAENSSSTHMFQGLKKKERKGGGSLEFSQECKRRGKTKSLKLGKVQIRKFVLRIIGYEYGLSYSEGSLCS